MIHFNGNQARLAFQKSKKFHFNHFIARMNNVKICANSVMIFLALADVEVPLEHSRKCSHTSGVIDINSWCSLEFSRLIMLFFLHLGAPYFFAFV